MAVEPDLTAIRDRYTRHGPNNDYYQPPGNIMFADCLALLDELDRLTAEHLAVMGATADLYASVNHYLTWYADRVSQPRVMLETVRDRLLAIGFGKEGIDAALPAGAANQPDTWPLSVICPVCGAPERVWCTAASKYDHLSGGVGAVHELRRDKAEAASEWVRVAGGPGDSDGGGEDLG